MGFHFKEERTGVGTCKCKWNKWNWFPCYLDFFKINNIWLTCTLQKSQFIYSKWFIQVIHGVDPFYDCNQYDKRLWLTVKLCVHTDSSTVLSIQLGAEEPIGGQNQEHK